MKVISKECSDIIKMMKKVWFKRKLYGWGWTPATWEGWTITIVYIIAIGILASALNEFSSPKEIMFTYFLPFLILTSIFILIAYKTGEKPKWQWGNKKI